MASDIILEDEEVLLDGPVRIGVIIGNAGGWGQAIVCVASDIVLQTRDPEDGVPRRALVHTETDGLTLNWRGSYPDGVTLEGNVKVPNQLTVGKLLADRVEIGDLDVSGDVFGRHVGGRRVRAGRLLIAGAGEIISPPTPESDPTRSGSDIAGSVGVDPGAPRRGEDGLVVSEPVDDLRGSAGDGVVGRADSDAMTGGVDAGLARADLDVLDALEAKASVRG